MKSEYYIDIDFYTCGDRCNCLMSARFKCPVCGIESRDSDISGSYDDLFDAEDINWVKVECPDCGVFVLNERDKKENDWKFGVLKEQK